MFKRLIIAVLTLGLLLTFSSAAISSNDAPKHGFNTIQTTNPSAPKYQDLAIIEQETPAFQKPPTAELFSIGTPTTVLPPLYFCEFIDYSGGAAAYYWKVPDVYNDTEMGMRFTPAEGYNCTLLTAYIGMYGSYMGAGVGTPDMLVSVYADDGFGLPGTLLGTVTVPWASLPTSGLAYVPVDLTPLGPLVFVDGEEFHVSASVYNFVDGDTLALLSDDGSNGLLRSWEVWNGLYGFMAYDWGIDINFLLGVDLCCDRIPFTDCYTQDYTCGVAYYWKQPDAYGDDYFNMRFSVGGPETLQEIGVALYGPPTTGTPAMDVFVWGSDGAGFPDLGNVIFSATIPYIDLQFFPNYNVLDLSGLNIVLTSDFHVGWSTNGTLDGDTLAGLSDNGSCGAGRSSEWWNGAFNSMLNDWGVDVNFLIYAEMCRDEFSQCKTLDYTCNLAYFWRLPDRYGDIGQYMRFTPAGEGCRLEKGRIAMYWPGSEAGLPLYSTNSEFQVFGVEAGTGLPDQLNQISGVTITPADYVLFPGWTEVDYTALPQILFDTDIWFGVESFAPDTLSGIRTLSDDGSCGSLRSAENWAGLMGYMLYDWGIDPNFLFQLDVCCVPLAEQTCVPGEDWPVMGKNFQRVFTSLSPLGDAQANLTKVWQYDADELMVYASPCIYSDTIVGYFLNHVAAVDINTGLEIWQRNPDGFEIGSGVFCTPTVYNFDAYGVPITLVYVAGGDTKAMTALELGTGATWWTRNFLDHSNHFMTFGASVVIDCAGVPVLVYADDNGDVYAVEALTGNPYGGWVPNPMNYGGPVFQGISTDGTQIYIGTQGGNVTAIDGCTGAPLWDLASSGGLQLPNLSPDNAAAPEDFTGCIAFEVFENEPTVFAASVFSQVSWPPYLGSGVMYSINATDGSLNWANLGISHDYGGISVDAGQVIHTGWTPWVPGYGELRGPTGYSKSSGAYTFDNTTTNPGLGDFWLMGTIKSCETEAPDLIVTQSRNDFVGFYRSSDGAMMFHRRWSGGVRAGHRTGMVMDDGHLLATYRNKIVCLVNDIERPRLDIPDYVVEVPVEFGSPDHTIVTVPGAIGNMGGAGLTINSVTLTDTDNGVIPPPSASVRTVNDELLDNMERIAQKFAANGENFRASFKDVDGNPIIDESRVTKSHAAYAVPAWVYGVVSPAPGTVIPPQSDFNDSSSYVDIDIDIDGTAVPRGVTAFFAEIDSDDPDYFLDDGAPLPQIELQLVGGCLFARETLEFGIGAEHFWYVWNTPIIGVGDLGHSAEIDGDDVSMWQGAYQFSAIQSGDTPNGKPVGVFSARVFTWADNWSSANPQTWQSLLPDPNCYDATCPPNHRTNVYLGDISNDDGQSYEQIFGEVVAYAFVDSAQDFCNYDTAGNCLSWDWTLGESQVVPYNDTLTVGFHGCVEVIGALDQPLLRNFIIDRMEMSGRYGPVSGIQFGAFMDLDITPDNSQQVNGYDADISAAWAYNCNPGSEGLAWGFVRIPFGCGYDVMVNSHSVSADGGGWNDTATWLDSVDYWMRTYTGLSHQQGPNPIDPIVCNSDPSDREGLHTVAAGMDFPQQGTGTYTIGVARFGIAVPGATAEDMADGDTYAEIAHTANKWSGHGRGDMNNDKKIDLVDIAYLIEYIYYGGNGPFPFQHLGDVNCDGQIDVDDVSYMMAYYFDFGPCMCGEWVLGGFTL